MTDGVRLIVVGVLVLIAAPWTWLAVLTEKQRREWNRITGDTESPLLTVLTAAIPAACIFGAGAFLFLSHQ